MDTNPIRPGRRRIQQGIVLVITLIAMALLMLAAAALQSSVQNTTVMAGNLGFRRDLVNRAEQGLKAAQQAFINGELAAEAARTADLKTSNYAASRLPGLDNGIPVVLASDSAFRASGFSAGDIVDNEVSVRYVIDRQCSAAGEFSQSLCESVMGDGDDGGSNWLRKPAGEPRPVYRITVRADGVRDTQVFVQSTFSF